MYSLRGMRVLVTGSSSGIGAAIASECIAQGATVMIHGDEERRAASVAQRLGTPAHYSVRDLKQPSECELLVEDAAQKLDGLDVVVNNAAVMTRSDLESTDHNVFDNVIGVNLRAPLLVARAAMPHLLASSMASVVNIGSVNAYCGEPNLLAYSIAKGGLMTLTKNLANAYADKRIRVNQLNVGWTLTENENNVLLRQGYPEDWAQRLTPSAAPSGRLLTPEEVAQHALFWMSPASSPITGTVYEVEQFPFLGRPASGDRLEPACP